MPTKKSTTAKGRDFELLVERLQRLLEPGEELLHNQFIPDIHTNEPRQVDIAIRKSSPPTLTVIECRDWPRPQHVEWIESAYGKRVSLGADTMVLVSKSGFGRPAQIKARALGILVRSYQETEDPSAIAAWVVRSQVKISRMDLIVTKVQLHTIPAKQPAPGPLAMDGRYFHLPDDPEGGRSIRELILLAFGPDHVLWDTIPGDGVPVPRTIVLNERACAGSHFRCGDFDYELSAITASALLWKKTAQPGSPRLVAQYTEGNQTSPEDVLLWRTVFSTEVGDEVIEFEIVQDGQHLKQIVAPSAGPMKIEFTPRVASADCD